MSKLTNHHKIMKCSCDKSLETQAKKFSIPTYNNPELICRQKNNSLTSIANVVRGKLIGGAPTQSNANSNAENVDLNITFDNLNNEDQISEENFIIFEDSYSVLSINTNNDDSNASRSSYNQRRMNRTYDRIEDLARQINQTFKVRNDEFDEHHRNFIRDNASNVTVTYSNVGQTIDITTNLTGSSNANLNITFDNLNNGGQTADESCVILEELYSVLTLSSGNESSNHPATRTNVAGIRSIKNESGMNHTYDTPNNPALRFITPEDNFYPNDGDGLVTESVLHFANEMDCDEIFVSGNDQYIPLNNDVPRQRHNYTYTYSSRFNSDNPSYENNRSSTNSSQPQNRTFRIEGRRIGTEERPFNQTFEEQNLNRTYNATEIHHQARVDNRIGSSNLNPIRNLNSTLISNEIPPPHFEEYFALHEDSENPNNSNNGQSMNRTYEREHPPNRTFETGRLGNEELEMNQTFDVRNGAGSNSPNNITFQFIAPEDEFIPGVNYQFIPPNEDNRHYDHSVVIDENISCPFEDVIIRRAAIGIPKERHRNPYLPGHPAPNVDLNSSAAKAIELANIYNVEELLNYSRELERRKLFEPKFDLERTNTFIYCPTSGRNSVYHYDDPLDPHMLALGTETSNDNLDLTPPVDQFVNYNNRHPQPMQIGEEIDEIERQWFDVDLRPCGNNETPNRDLGKILRNIAPEDEFRPGEECEFKLHDEDSRRYPYPIYYDENIQCPFGVNNIRRAAIGMPRAPINPDLYRGAPVVDPQSSLVRRSKLATMNAAELVNSSKEAERKLIFEPRKIYMERSDPHPYDPATDPYDIYDYDDPLDPRMWTANDTSSLISTEESNLDISNNLTRSLSANEVSESYVSSPDPRSAEVLMNVNGDTYIYNGEESIALINNYSAEFVPAGSSSPITVNASRDNNQPFFIRGERALES